MADRKPVFDAIKAFRNNAPFTQDDVNRIDTFLDTFAPRTGFVVPEIEPAPHKSLQASTIKAAWASERKYGVPSSVSLAQYALESAWGKKNMGIHNYGGIKAAKADFGPNGLPTVPYKLLPTREVIKGQNVTMNQFFRAFASEEDFFLYHAALIATRPVYAAAMAALPNLTEFVRVMADGGDGQGGRPGYATDPNYANAIMNLMRTSKLLQYNLGHYTGV